MSKQKKITEKLLEEVLLLGKEQPYEVPENWMWTTIQQVVPSMKARDPKKLKSKMFHYIDVDAVDNKKQVVTNVKELRVSEAPSRARRRVNKGDVIISLVRPYLKNIAIISEQDESLVASTAFYVNSPTEVLTSQYLYNYLRTECSTQYLIANTKGDNSPSVRSTDYEKMPIPIPPIDEQERIVEKVERLLKKIEEAKMLIEEAKETFELRRVAILDKAFRGELTKKWREQHKVESAKLRYEKIKKGRLAVVESNRELKDVVQMFEEYEQSFNGANEWLYLKANMFCYNINCGRTPSAFIEEAGEVPFLKVYNIVNNKIQFDYKPQFIPKNIHNEKLAKSRLYPNDVIMNIVGPPLRKVALIPSDYQEWNMNQAIVRFRPINGISPKFIYYCLQYDKTLDAVISETRGVVGQSNISINQSRNLVMPIPSTEEQNEIVRILDSILEKEESYLQYTNQQENLDALKSSILSKAFRGELGTNDSNEESVIELFKEVLHNK
ncbi:restriction endonuclease subunit S [Bacillus cereus]